MSEDARQVLIAGLEQLFEPLLRVLLRQGVSIAEVDAIVARAFVKAGSTYLARRGDPVTASRIAALTGQQRQRVSALLGGVGDKARPPPVHRQHVATQHVLTGWHEDRTFQTRTGGPALLPMTGEGASFQRLVETHARISVQPATILRELLQSGAVVRNKDKTLRAVRRSAVRGGTDPETLRTMAEAATALFSTFEHNLTEGPEAQLPVRGIRRAAPSVAVPLFRAQMTRRADAFVEMTDAFLEGSVGATKVSAGGEAAATLMAYVFAAAVAPTPEPLLDVRTRRSRELAAKRARLKPAASAVRRV